MKLHNGIAILENDTHISKWVVEHNSLIHNKGFEKRLKELISPTDVVLEIGAFIGDNTAILNDIGCEVYSFEPNIKAFECLVHNSKNWENVRVFNKGLGEKISKANINLSTNVGASQLEKDSKGEIGIITIDSLSLNKLDFIIMDCEGWELNVLRGGVETIKKFMPKMLIEINKGALEKQGVSYVEVFQFLDKLGYQYENIFNEPMQGEQYDIICWKKA